MASAPQQWLLCGVCRGSGIGSCSLPLSGSVGPHLADPHTDNPLHCAHTLVEGAGPLVCGGGNTANVGEAACAMGWLQCWGSGTKRGRTGVQRGQPRDNRSVEKEEEKRQKDVSGLARIWVEKKEEAEKRAGEQ